MQQLRRYLTTPAIVAGAIGLVGLTPVTPQHPGPPAPQQHAIALTATDPITPYLDLVANTATNLGAMVGNTLEFPVVSQLIADPLGSLQNLPNAIGLLLTLLPDIDVDTSALPVSITADMPPLPGLLLATLAPLLTTGNALAGIGADVFNLFNDPLGAVSAVLAAPALLADALLNARDGFGIIGLNVPIFNGILVPGRSLDTTVDLGQLTDNVGLGDKTLPQLFDLFGIGDTQAAATATNLLDALGLGDQTPVQLADAIGLGGKQVNDIAAALLNALGIGQSTPVELVDQLGVGSQTVASLATNLLDALGLGQQNPVQLLDATGLGNVTLGTALANLLAGLGQSELTVGGLVTELGFADVSVGDFLTAGQLTNTSVGSILSSLGFNLSLNDLFAATGGATVSGGGLVSLMPTFNNLTLEGILANQGLTPDTTVLDILTQQGLADQTLTALLLQNPTTLHDVLVNAGWGQESLDTMVTGLLGNTTVSSLLSSFGLNEQDLATMLQSMPADTTVSDLLGGTAFGNTELDTIVTDLLGGATINELLSELGLNSVTIAELLTDLGVADTGLASTDIGDFFGLIPAIVNGLPEQIAQALGA